MTDKITVNLNIFDEDNQVVDERTAELTIPQISDIIDHATQIILMRREGKSMESALDELDEALAVADVISG